ncbi:MAG: hypothetical protein LBI63_05980, partial [Candidatus Ancillula sp.]|nr:hypothetical protein [Candidatus Ancillula sp.]
MWLMDKNAYRNSKLAEKNSAENSAENSASCKQLVQDNLHVAKSSTSIKKRDVNRSGFSTSIKKRGKIGAENLVHTRTRLYASISTDNNKNTSTNNSKSTSAQNMRNFGNFHAKITPLIAVFALVAFSIFTFIKLPAFAQ